MDILWFDYSRKETAGNLALTYVDIFLNGNLKNMVNEAGFEGKAPGKSKATDDMAVIVRLLLKEAG